MQKIFRSEDDISIPYDGRYNKSKIIHCYDRSFMMMEFPDGTIRPRNQKNRYACPEDHIFNRTSFVDFKFQGNENNHLTGVIFIRYQYDYIITSCIYDEIKDTLYIWKESCVDGEKSGAKFSLFTQFVDKTDIEKNEGFYHHSQNDQETAVKGDLVFSCLEERYIHTYSANKRSYNDLIVNGDFNDEDISLDENGCETFNDINGKKITLPPLKILLYRNITSIFRQIIRYIDFCNENFSSPETLKDRYNPLQVNELGWPLPEMLFSDCPYSDDYFDSALQLYKFNIIDVPIDDINMKIFEDFYEDGCYEQISLDVRIEHLFYLLDINRIKCAINFCMMMVKYNSNTLNFTRCFFMKIIKYKNLLNFYKENLPDMLFPKKQLRLQEYNSKSKLDKLNYRILVRSRSNRKRYNRLFVENEEDED